jgi:hypothetical protein
MKEKSPDFGNKAVSHASSGEVWELAEGKKDM